MTFRNALVPTLLAAAVMAMLPSVAHAERAFTVRDMAALDRYSSPALSPDGRKLVFAKRVADLDANKASTSPRACSGCARAAVGRASPPCCRCCASTSSP